MISFLTTLFIATFILQPTEWISIFSGIPLQELLMLIIVMLTAITKSDVLFTFFKLKTTRFFLAYIFMALVGYTVSGYGAGIFLSEHAPKVLRYFLSYMVVVIGLDSLSKIRFSLLVSMMSALLVALLCIRLRETGLGVGAGIGVTVQELNWRGGVQWLGQVSGSNSTAFLLVTQLGLTLTFLSKAERGFKKMLAIFSLVAILLAILYTGSRGGLLGTIGVFAFFGMIKYQISIKKAVPLGIVLLAALFVLKPTSDDRGLRDSSSNERVELMYHGLQMLKENPFVGVGYNRFHLENPIRKVAHNIYLQQIAENGLIGASFFFLMFYTSIRNSKKYYDENQDDQLLKNTTLGIWCSSVGLAICTFFLSASHFLPYIILGLITSLPGPNALKYKLGFSELRLVLGIEILSIALIYIAINVFAAMFF